VNRLRVLLIASGCLACAAACGIASSIAVHGQGVTTAILDVSSFGCKADGISDDSQCLHSAMDYVRRHRMGKIVLGAGVYYVPSGLKLDVDSIALEGQGTNTSPVSHATTIRCLPSADCVTVGSTKEVNSVSLRALTITNGSTRGSGSCLRIDGREATIARLLIEQVEVTNCGSYGIALEGGQGRGGFIFSVGLKGIGIDDVGGTGLYIHGRVGQLSAQNIWVAKAAAPVVIDGGKLSEASGMDFQDLTASNSDHGHYCMQLRDASSLIFRNPHLEECPFGLALIQSVQNSTFDGGGYYKQAGTAFGFTFDVGASGGCDCNILLNPQGATNTSIHRVIHNTGSATIGDVQLGWTSRHRLTRADIDGSLPEFIGSFEHGFVSISMAGDPVQFVDATAREGVQGTLFDALRRDPRTNAVYVGNDTAPGRNGMISKGPATFEKSVSIGIPGKTIGAPLLQVNGTISAAGLLSSINEVPFSAQPIFDAAAGSVQKMTLTGSVQSSSLVHAASGQTLTFVICEDARGGWGFRWPSEMKGAASVNPSARTCTVQQFLYDGSRAYAISPAVLDR
jgi:hypothetical protein